MVNIAATFGVMYAMEKTTEVRWFWKPAMFFPAVLAASVALYYLSYFLHSHPGWIVSLFDSSVLL
jgi:hypothetical protein